MSAIRLPAAQHLAQPWKNGLGVSRVIAGFPSDAGFDTLLWQVGSTEIGADCPFSELRGLDRQFMIIEGAGVELTCVDETGNTTINRVDTPLAPLSFRGDWRTTCRLLAGPVRVLNVITRRHRCSATIEIAPHLDALRKAAGETLLAVDPVTLDAWRLDGPFAGIGRVALVRIRSE